MRTKRRLVLVLIALLMVIFLLPAFSGCTENPAGNKNGDSEFVFEGSGTFMDGNDYNVVITGNKDAEKTFKLTVKEIPALELTGTWVFVEGKGYKLYFADAGNSYSYSYYDTATKKFSLSYTLNLSGGLGSTKINFTCLDEAFAAVYDGEGLPPHPPTFEGAGFGNLAAITPYYWTLICNEDGTCAAVPARADIDTRRGTYSYDAEANVYSFVFEDQLYTPNYLFEDTDGKRYYRHMYTASMDNTLEFGQGYSELIEYVDAGSQPQFNDSVWHIDENGEKVVTEFKTKYDEATKTYSLIFEAFAKCFMDIYVTYTVE